MRVQVVLCFALLLACNDSVASDPLPGMDAGPTRDSDAGATGVANDATIENPEFDAGTDKNRNRVEPGGICQRLVEIQCAAERHCCGHPSDSMVCIEELRDTCAGLYLDAASEKSVSGFDPDVAEAVFFELERLAADCNPSIAHYAMSSDGLRSMFRGTLAPGEDCRGPNIEVRNPESGLAAAAPYMVACHQPDTYACLPDVVDGWRCKKRGTDSRCTSELNCKDGHYCDGHPVEGGGECQRRKRADEPCELPIECRSLNCHSEEKFGDGVEGTCAKVDQQTVYCVSGR